MNKLLFIAFILLCSIVSAQSLGTDPCPNDTDGYCMNAKAIEYVNQLRREEGRSALGSGSIYMFDNAMDHSKVQNRQKRIFHQPVGRGVQVGQGQCEVTLSGENVAFYSNERIKNAPMYCVMELWRNSPGHYQNMIAPTHRNTVIAIYSLNGRVTCTQTFSRTPLAGTGKCSAALPANGGNRPAEGPTEPTVQEPSAEETPIMNETPTTNNETPANNEAPSTDETPASNKAPMTQETPAANEERKTEETPMAGETPITNEANVNQETPMEEGNRMRLRRKNKMRLGRGPGRRSMMMENYIILTFNGKRTKLALKNLNGSYYICNPETKRCFNRRTSMKIMSVLISLN